MDAVGEVEADGRGEVSPVDADLDKDVQGLDGGRVDGDETRVAVVDHHVAPEGASRVVVDAARAVRHVAHDDALGRGEALEDVDDGAAVHGEALGHLEGDANGAGAEDLGDRLWDLEVVVVREEVLDGGLKQRVDLFVRLESCGCDDGRRCGRR